MQLESPPGMPSGPGDFQQSPKYKIVPAIGVAKTIRVVQADGTKGAPLVITEVVPGPVNELGNSTVLKVDVTDAFLTTASDKHTLSVQVLGDYLADWWTRNKHKYEIAVPPEEMVAPIPPEFPGGGLRLPGGLIVEWQNDFAGEPRVRIPSKSKTPSWRSISRG